MTKDNFKNILLGMPLDDILNKYILEATPSIFGKNNDQFYDWKKTVSAQIKVDSKCIVIVGGASIGFSLNPRKNLKNFDKNSDIDVAIISSFYFNVAWNFMQRLGLSWYYWDLKGQQALKDHRERLIYWGTIATDKILQYLPFGKDWILSVDEIKKLAPTKNRDINFRIYKDFESLRLYQKSGLEKLRVKITRGSLS